MTLSLKKGGNISLSKTAPGMNASMVGLGWDERATSGADFDLDAVVFVCGADGKVRSNDDFIFYGQLQSKDGSIVHQGDNLTGAGEGDDEQVLVNLASVPNDVQKIAICVTIHEAAKHGLNFGMVSNAFVRIVDANTNAEIVKYDLGEDYSIETAMIFGELYRHGDNGKEWKFRAIGQGFNGGLKQLAEAFGVTGVTED